MALYQAPAFDNFFRYRQPGLYESICYFADESPKNGALPGSKGTIIFRAVLLSKDSPRYMYVTLLVVELGYLSKFIFAILTVWG